MIKNSRYDAVHSESSRRWNYSSTNILNGLIRAGRTICAPAEIQ